MGESPAARLLHRLLLPGGLAARISVRKGHKHLSSIEQDSVGATRCREPRRVSRDDELPPFAGTVSAAPHNDAWWKYGDRYQKPVPTVRSLDAKLSRLLPLCLSCEAPTPSYRDSWPV